MFSVARLERCQSGRMGRTRNAVCLYRYLGFESLPLRTIFSVSRDRPSSRMVKRYLGYSKANKKSAKTQKRARDSNRTFVILDPLIVSSLRKQGSRPITFSATIPFYSEPACFSGWPAILFFLPSRLP